LHRGSYNQNPAFGGDTFNYQWMIGSAESQNKFKDPELQEMS
jgi:curli production assembly/transport component CsgF